MLSRRQMIKMVSGIPVLAGMVGGGLFKRTTEELAGLDFRNYLQELGVPAVINARGHNTVMTGCIMWPEVLEAINSTSQHFVPFQLLQDRAGERIADMIGCEAAMVTAGAASALTLGTAACVTGMDSEKIHLIPNLPGPQPEVIVQKTHRFSYDHAVRNAGVKLVEVETRRELERAINNRTVMMLFFSRVNERGDIKHEEFVELGKKHGVPTMNDCAAELPPVENLWRFTDMGFDLVAFSGGKELRGPQSAGLLLGRKDLIAAARAQSNPIGDAIGRGMKVNKEEIVGMTVALEKFIQADHDAIRDARIARVKYVGDHLKDFPGLSQEITMNEEGYVGEVNIPILRLSWDRDVIRRTPGEVQQALIAGHPSIYLVTSGDGITVNLRMERPGTERIVARRVHEELSKGLA